MFSNGFPKEWSTLRKLVWLYRTVINAVSAVLKTVTGNPIHITDALAKPAQALSVALEPIQDLHGYDNPWPAGGGKNKLPVTATTQTINGVTFTVNDDGTITVSGTATANATLVVYGANASSPDDITIVSESVISTDTSAITGVVWKSSSGTTFNTGIYTISAGTVLYGFGIRVLSGETANNIIVKPMLRLSTESATFAPYSNECPISGFTGLTLYRSDEDTSNPTTYPVTWQSEAGTVYGGTLDVTTGVLTVDRKIVDLGALGWYSTTWGGWRSAAIADLAIIDPAVVSNILAEKYKSSSRDTLTEKNNAISTGSASNKKALFVLATDRPTGQCVYPLATPQTYQLTPTEVVLLLGENNIWSDANGDLSLTYYADGNASDAEALGILLGSRYFNNHTEDEPSDREALNIILGGNER